MLICEVVHMLTVHKAFPLSKPFSCLLQLRTHIKEVNAVFYKNSSSFALYRGNGDDDDFVPYQVYSKVFLRDEDKMRINMLRKWLVNFQIPAGTTGFWLLM